MFSHICYDLITRSILSKKDDFYHSSSYLNIFVPKFRAKVNGNIKNAQYRHCILINMKDYHINHSILFPCSHRPLSTLPS